MKKLPLYLFTLLLVLLPLKFGGLAVMTEAGGFYPENGFDWLFITWPPHSLGYFGGGLLLLILLSGNWHLSRRESLLVGLWSLGSVLAVLPGMFRGEMVIALGEISLLFGAGSVIFSGALLAEKYPQWVEKFAAAIIVGGVLTAFYGWHQHIFALDEMRNFVAEQEAAGIPLSDGMRLKLTDPRIYSTLASSNTLASMLMIMLILGWYLGGKWSVHVTPPVGAKYAFRLFFVMLFVSVLVLTRSRSALFCPLAAGMLALFSCPGIRRSWRLAGIILGALVVAAGILFAVHFGRGMASMGERADYLRSSAVLCMKYPLAGAGWGGFFRAHMQMKQSPVMESARDPHNVVASFASQCGVVSGVMMLAVLLMPLAVLWKKRFDGSFPCAVFWCGTIFTLHSLIDCDWQVPALVAIMGVLYALAILPQEPEDDGGGKWRRQLNRMAAVIVAAGGIWSSYWYISGDKALSMLMDRVHPPTPEAAAALSVYPVELLAEKAVSWRPESAVIPMTLGDWYFRAGSPELAEKSYQQALQLDPARPAAFARLAKIALLRGDRENAEKLMLKAHALFPKSANYTITALYENN